MLRDRVLSGFGVRLNAHNRTFLIATSVSGKQFRMMLGYWPLMSVDEARSPAMDVLRQCRNGERPSRKVKLKVPTLREAYLAYCTASYLSPPRTAHRPMRYMKVNSMRTRWSRKQAPIRLTRSVKGLVLRFRRQQ
ncbi:MAG: DUF4102 domain-containing protein [Rhodoferax sp.]|nr:DUF4102 domain-containing protein [Rhodoferax sp.]